MDTQELRTLKLLEEIENGKAPSQRDLAKKLNVSLGLVNSFIKRLANKGYFKITHIPKNRVSYILTPKGAAEKTRLTYNYIQYSFSYYKGARENLRKLFTVLEDQGIRRIAFFGAGDLAEIACISLQETEIALVCVFDENRHTKKFFGLEIIKFDQLREHFFDCILITATEKRNAVRDKIRAQGISSEQIILL